MAPPGRSRQIALARGSFFTNVAAMNEVTCPNCNVDADPEELKQNNLHCPTCGFDMSEAKEPDDLDDGEDGDEDEDEDEDEEEDEK